MEVARGVKSSITDRHSYSFFSSPGGRIILTLDRGSLARPNFGDHWALTVYQMNEIDSRLPLALAAFITRNEYVRRVTIQSAAILGGVVLLGYLFKNQIFHWIIPGIDPPAKNADSVPPRSLFPPTSLISSSYNYQIGPKSQISQLTDQDYLPPRLQNLAPPSGSEKDIRTPVIRTPASPTKLAVESAAEVTPIVNITPSLDREIPFVAVAIVPLDNGEIMTTLSVEKTFHQLHSFLKNHYGNSYRIQRAMIDHHVSRGTCLLNQIITGQVLRPDPSDAGDKFRHQQDVIDLSWAIFNLSVNKDGGFHQGSLLIEDPNGQLGDFFEQHDQAHSRWSSHLDGQAQKGIDVIGEVHELEGRVEFLPFVGEHSLFNSLDLMKHNYLEHAALPTDKSHILFGRIMRKDRPFLFLKLENHGLRSAKGLIAHGYEYGWSFYERILSPWVNYAMGYEPSSLKIEKHRKERVERQTSILYRTLVKRVIEKRPPELSVLERLNGATEVSQMIDEVVNIGQDGEYLADAAIQEAVQEFFRDLNSRMLDNIDHRIGNEVIFTVEQLVDGLRTFLPFAQAYHRHELAHDDDDYEHL